MLKKLSFPILGLSLGAFLISPPSYGQGQSTTTSTTSTTIETTVPKSAVKKAPVKKAAPAAATTSVTSTTTTTEVVKPPPPKEVVHKPYDTETLKKMSDTLCTDGFKAYVGNEEKNVCLSKATAPDIAYTCVWDKEGTPAYAPTKQGPCSLDYTEHAGSIVIKKETFEKNPPLKYGVEALCCFRPAKGLEMPVSSR